MEKLLPPQDDLTYGDWEDKLGKVYRRQGSGSYASSESSGFNQNDIDMIKKRKEDLIQGLDGIIEKMADSRKRRL